MTDQAMLRWAGDRAILLTLRSDDPGEVVCRLHSAIEVLREGPLPGVRDLHPGSSSILVDVDPLAVDPGAIEEAVREALARVPSRPRREGRLFEIPVCYEGEMAPDLAEVALLHGRTAREVVDLHASVEYVVHFLGFVAGFPYLAGLPAELATPRLPVPRRSVPAGSVAIGGSHAGVYPFSTPGGWRILGRTPIPLFRADRQPPALLAPGDRVRFVPIVRDEFLAQAGD